MTDDVLSADAAAFSADAAAFSADAAAFSADAALRAGGRWASLEPKVEHPAGGLEPANRAERAGRIAFA